MLHFFNRPGFIRIIPGEGMPLVDNPDKKGDLTVEFDIEFPKSLTSDSKDLIKRALVPNAYKKEEKPKKQNLQVKSSDFED
jgi:DnaJ-class molecular chaperone